MRGRKVRRAALVAVPIVVVAIGAVAAFATPEPSAVTMRANFHRMAVKSVSSQAELVSILGPPGDHTTGPTTACSTPEHAEVRYDYLLGLPVDYWKTDTWEVKVLCAMDGCAILEYSTCAKTPQSRIENLLWRAKRQWHRWFP